MPIQQNTKTRVGWTIVMWILGLFGPLAFAIIDCRIHNKDLAFIQVKAGSSDVIDLAAYQEARSPIALENSNELPSIADANSIDILKDSKVSIATNSDQLH